MSMLFLLQFIQLTTEHILTSKQSLVLEFQLLILNPQKLDFISILVQSISIFILMTNQRCIVHIFECQLIFLFYCLYLLLVIKMRNFDSRVISLDWFGMKSQFMFFVVLIEINANFGKRLLRIFETKTRLNGIKAIPFASVAVRTALS